MLKSLLVAIFFVSLASLSVTSPAHADISGSARGGSKNGCDGAYSDAEQSISNYCFNQGYAYYTVTSKSYCSSSESFDGWQFWKITVWFNCHQ